MKTASLLATVIVALAAAGAAYAEKQTVADGDAETKALMPPPPEIMFKLMDEPKYEPLFEDDLSNAIFAEGGWVVEDGVLTAKGKGDIWTKARYGNFILALEFKCAEKTNSGVFIRCGALDEWLHTCIEVQILQNNDDYDNPKHHCGGIFDCLEPVTQMVREPGEWNKYIIVAKDNILWVFLNNELVTYMDLDKWTEPHKNPDGTRNKFKNAYKDMPREGHIGLQYHGQDVWFRNIRLEPLD
ncbi:MAG TPA: DUF1080 domain-containing protein [Candidatus Hydrogenedentes bacterium]|nr:DUF1080 domain-containing protein [Candidatus Hydrogenedentota bacterium]